MGDSNPGQQNGRPSSYLRKRSIPLFLLAGAIGLFAVAILYSNSTQQPHQPPAPVAVQEPPGTDELAKVYTTPGGAISSVPVVNNTPPPPPTPQRPPAEPALSQERLTFLTIMIPALGTLGMGIFTTYSQYWKKQDQRPLYDSLYTSKADHAEVLRRLDDLRQVINRDVVLTEANKENIAQLEAAIKDLENEIEQYKDAVNEKLNRLSERVTMTEYKEGRRDQRESKRPPKGAPFGAK